MESDDEPINELEIWNAMHEYQRVDNSDDTSEVIGAADEYFSIQQEV